MLPSAAFRAGHVKSVFGHSQRVTSVCVFAVLLTDRRVNRGLRTVEPLADNSTCSSTEQLFIELDQGSTPQCNINFSDR